MCAYYETSTSSFRSQMLANSYNIPFLYPANIVIQYLRRSFVVVHSRLDHSETCLSSWTVSHNRTCHSRLNLIYITHFYYYRYFYSIYTFLRKLYEKEFYFYVILLLVLHFKLTLFSSKVQHRLFSTFNTLFIWMQHGQHCTNFSSILKWYFGGYARSVRYRFTFSFSCPSFP